MKILGIDDNEDLLSLCEIALVSDGHEYTGINNAREGLQAIKDKKFDVVLLDLAMPEVSGTDVIDALVKEGLMNKQKVIIFTASSATEEEFGPLLEKGAHSVLKKPLDIDDLIETVKKIGSED